MIILLYFTKKTKAEVADLLQNLKQGCRGFFYIAKCVFLLQIIATFQIVLQFYKSCSRRLNIFGRLSLKNQFQNNCINKIKEH